MTYNITLTGPDLATTIRTLLLSGYEVENNRRQPTHTEILCRAPVLSTTVPLLIALSQEDEIAEHTIEQLHVIATKEGRNLVVVAAAGNETQLGWQDFLDRFGGAVPSWRVLADSYPQQLHTASNNNLPSGVAGEAWRAFEILAADGLEFCLGRKVLRLGGAKRGQKVSDMLTQIPDGQVLVIDAKATETSFDAAIYKLRALAEYTKKQRVRQKGFNEVVGALVISSRFKQDNKSLAEISREFLADTQVPAAFLTASSLAHMVAALRADPQLRPGLNWRRLFAGGAVGDAEFDKELNLVRSERY